MFLPCPVAIVWSVIERAVGERFKRALGIDQFDEEMVAATLAFLAEELAQLKESSSSAG